MQLFVCVNGCWKCLDVQLINGCVPSIGGIELANRQIEPAQWFKVLVLRSVSVDCSERVVSWDVGESNQSEDGICNRVALAHDRELDSGSEALSLVSREDGHSTSRLFSSYGSGLDGNHSLMAAHDDSPISCSGDLQTLFELAETLYEQKASIGADSPSQERRMWLQLLHCYLLPLITFQREDLLAVSLAQTNHMQLLHCMDQGLEEISLKASEIKEKLATLFSHLMPYMENWAFQSGCSCTFLSLITSDIKRQEQNARAKIQSSARNIEFNERLGTSQSPNFSERFHREKNEAEQVLMEMLQLRSILDGAVALSDNDTTHEVQGLELQTKYVRLHADLNFFRQKSVALSSEKVLALSVREAFDQTICCLSNGQATSGMDVGLQGGHSTDVLREASPMSVHDSANYLTWREKIQMILQLQSTPLTQLHDSFFHQVRQHLLPSAGNELRALPTEQTKSLAILVNDHFKTIVDHICSHFNNRSSDFVERVWLCYERLFFESFSESIFSLYQAEQTKCCKQLMENAIGLSIIEPHNLDLGVVEESWLLLFPPRHFIDASSLYQEVTTNSSSNALKSESSEAPYLEYFSGVMSDLQSLPLAISPLDRVQLLISAFRKAMAGLSKLKLEPCHATAVMMDANLASVNCDEILPVLVLLMLQLPPQLLAILHLNCCLISDYMAPFLSLGWHGYSLTTFSSTLQIINKL